MGSVRRIYVEKKQPYAVHAKELKEEVKRYLGIKSITNVRVLIRYDVENLSEATYKQALGTVFSEPPVDNCYENEFEKADGSFVFSVEYLPGQFDQRADSCEQCIQILTQGERCRVRKKKSPLLQSKRIEDGFALQEGVLLLTENRRIKPERIGKNQFC